MEKFECKKCGGCCRNKKYLPLWEWEFEEFKKLGEEEGMDLDFRPLGAVLDKKSGLVVFIQYGLFSQGCPFLKDDKCLIYENRALTCKIVPLAKNPLIGNEKFDLSAFMECENFDAKDFIVNEIGVDKKLDREELGKKFFDFFGESFIYSLQSEMIKRFVESNIKNMVSRGVVEFIEVNEKDIGEYEVLPFFKFLERIGVIDEKVRVETINELRDKKRIINMFGVDKYL